MLTRSPTTRPRSSSCGPTAASPVRMPTRTAREGRPMPAPSLGMTPASSRPARTARSASSSPGGDRAPDRHHRVADVLLDEAAEALDRLPGRGEVGHEEGAHLLGIARLREGGEPDQVGEEHRHEAALGPERHGVTGGTGRLGGGQRRAALSAEALPGQVRRAADGAGDGEPGTATRAVLAARPVLGGALPADHFASLGGEATRPRTLVPGRPVLAVEGGTSPFSILRPAPSG